MFSSGANANELIYESIITLIGIMRENREIGVEHRPPLAGSRGHAGLRRGIQASRRRLRNHVPSVALRPAGD